MARAGEILEDPISGQRMIFRKTAGDPGGRLLEVESAYMKPTSSRPPVHRQPADVRCVVDLRDAEADRDVGDDPEDALRHEIARGAVVTPSR